MKKFLITHIMVAFISSCGGSSEGSNKARKESVSVSNKSLVYLGNGESKEVERVNENDNLKFVRSLQLIPYKRIPLTGESVLAKGLATVTHYYSLVQEQASLYFEFGELFVDPFCVDGTAFNGAYFAEIGNRKKFICLNITEKEGEITPIVTEPFVFLHELFHSLWVPRVQAGIYNRAVQLSHELDSLNEGAADHFADLFSPKVSSSEWLFEKLQMPWRNDLTSEYIEPAYTYSDVNTDGQFYRRLLNDLSESGENTVSVLACIADHINEDFKRAVKVAPQTYSYFYSHLDIHDALKSCVENKEAFFSLLTKQFPISTENLLEEAKLNVIAIPTEDALCDVQQKMNLQMTDWVSGQLLDACGELTSYVEVGGAMKWARSEPSDNPNKNNEPVYLLVTWNDEQQGEFSECKFVLNVEKAGGEWATERLLRTDEDHIPPFILKVPQTMRGSHYRIQPMPDPSLETSVQLPWDDVGILPLKNNKINGFVLSQSFENKPGDSLNEKYQRLADKVFSVFSQYHRSNGSELVEHQNFNLECSSHLESLSEDKPLGDMKFIKNRIENVFIHACEKGEGGDECQLRRYSR